jgi:hypothetical protein
MTGQSNFSGFIVRFKRLTTAKYKIRYGFSYQKNIFGKEWLE